jgi:hypothetical protein
MGTKDIRTGVRELCSKAVNGHTTDIVSYKTAT